METVYYKKNKMFSSEYYIKSFYLDINKYDVTELNLLISVLTVGTKNYPSKAKLDKISRELYGLNFALSASEIIDKIVFEYNFNYLDPKLINDKDYNYEEINKFILEFIYNPNIIDGKFPADVFINEKRNLKTGVIARDDNKRYVISHDSYLGYYKDVPKIFLDSKLEDIDKITNEDLVSLYYKIREESQIFNFCYGKIDFKDNPIVNQYQLSDEIVGFSYRSSFKKEIYKIHKTYETNSSYLMLGFDTDVHYNEDEIMAINTFNDILGGGANSRLFKNVREKNGLCYSIYSALDREYGKMFIVVNFDSKDYKQIKELIFEQLEDLKTGNISDTEVEEAKLGQTSNLLVGSDNAKYFLYKLKRRMLYKQLSVNETAKMINNVTKEEVIKIANNIKLEYEFYGEAK